MALSFSLGRDLVELLPMNCSQGIFVHRNPITRESLHFYNLIHSLGNSSDGTTTFFKVSTTATASAIEAFIEFATTGEIYPDLNLVPTLPKARLSSPFVPMAFLEMVDCYVFGVEYRAHNFSNAILDLWRISFARRPGGDHFEAVRKVWRLEDRKVEFLKKFLIHIYAVLTRSLSECDELPGDFLLKVANKKTQLLHSSRKSKLVNFRDDTAQYLRNMDLKPYYLTHVYGKEALQQGGIIVEDDEEAQEASQFFAYQKRK